MTAQPAGFRPDVAHDETHDVYLVVWHRNNEPPELALRKRGGRVTDDGLLVWQDGLPGSTTIRTLVFHVDDGIITDLGGGCAPGGEASASCAVVGNGQFHHTLSWANTPLPYVPALVGLKLVEQWLVAAGGGCPQVGIAFSNGIVVELQ